MFNSFSKTALRVLQRNKSFAALNITGLAIGIAASLLIFLVIRNELSYDRYHKNADRIYRVVGTSTLRSNGEIARYVNGVPNPFPKALQLDFPAIEAVGAVVNFGEAQVYVPGKDLADEKKFKENQGMVFVNPGLFKIFDHNWVAGNATGLKDPNTVVLAESVANTFFGSSAKAIGSVIQLWSFRTTFRVIGVFKDQPANTDVPVRLGFSFETLRTLSRLHLDDQDAWRRNNEGLYCFVLAPATQPIERLQAQLPSFVKKYYIPDPESPLSLPRLRFQPLKEMHLDKRFETFKNDALSIKELWALGFIGLFLLLVACINFINLATAQSVTRAKEIGVRKVLGSDVSQIRKQFLYETGFITILAVALGCLLALLALPWLSHIMQKDLSLHLINTPSVLLFIVLLTVVVTLLAGFYPAIVLSGFNPVMIFKNKMTVKIAGGISLRKGLVVFQFVIAQLLIVGTIVVVKQMQYFRNRSIGFEKDGIALINLPSDSSLMVKWSLLKNSLSQVPGVTSATLCMGAPANFWEWNAPVYFNNETRRRDFRMSYQFGDTGYYKTFDIKLAAGRFPFHSDTIHEIVINETAVKQLGFSSPEEVIGKTMSYTGEAKYPIVGVIRDYNNRSLHSAITPLAVGPNNGAYEWIAVRVDKNNMTSRLDQLKKVFTQIYPTYLYDQVFLDERIAQYYKSEAITAQLFKVFAFLAIFISCLGLYGLVSFMAVQKTKEVGIRKVLGASVQNIVYLFSKEFTVLIGIAFLIAAPVGYYFMKQWLSGFYYHINLGWSVFAIAVISSVIVAWLTVGYKAIKAALVNPVKSLKTE